MVKYRVGFVSNSSSSSYICDICNEVFSGWDLGLKDFELYQCVNNHVFCESHTKHIPFVTKERMLELFEKEKSWIDEEEMEEIREAIEVGDREEMDEILADYLEDGRYGVIPEQCPLCSLVDISDRDALSYFMKRTGLTHETLLKEIRGKFKNYAEFQSYGGDSPTNTKA